MWFRSLLASWKSAFSRSRRPQPRPARRGSFRPRLEVLEDRLVPASYSAASVADLIADIAAANAAGGTNTISLTAPTTSPYVLTTWNAWTGDSGNGLPLIAANDNLTIVGNGDTIERGATELAFRLLNVAPLGSLTLENLTLQGGLVKSVVAPAGVEGKVGPSGGAIYNLGALTLSGVTVASNETDGEALSGNGGGGIWSNGSLTLENGTVLQSNFALVGAASAPACGGAVYIAGGTANISNTTFTSNEANSGAPGTFGGALYVAAGQVILTNTTVNNNSALALYIGYGGGLYIAGGTVTLTNSTVESNVADNYGGGLCVAGGTVTLANDTVESNTAYWGGGGGLYVADGTVTLTSDTVQSNMSSYYPGGGIDIVSGATVYLDAFTVANTLNNTDNTGLNGSTANINGPYIETPAAGQPPLVAQAASASPSPVTGTTTSLSVLGADAAGFSSLTYTWAVTSAPAGAATPTFSSNGANVSQNTTATFHLAGTYTFQVTITDPSGLTAVSNVTVTVVQTVSSISITPGNYVTVADGAKQQFTAVALDQFGQALAAQPTFTWQVSSSSGGTISSSGLYTAPKKGKGAFQVEVSADGLTAAFNVTVT